MLLPNRHFSPFKLFLDSSSRTALMLNPKVLTTFTRAMLADGWREHRGHADPSDGRWPFLSVPRRFPVARLSVFLNYLRQPQAWDSHAFVRNPYGRLASAWRNKFVDGHNASPDGRTSAYPRSIRQHHLVPLRRFAARNGLEGAAEGTPVPFDTFLRYALNRPAGARDHHWDLQSRVLMTDRISYAAIWRIEDSRDEGFLTLGRRLGFPDDWVLNRLQKPANPSVAKPRAYTAETAALARQLVQEDLDRFGYAPESWQQF